MGSGEEDGKRNIKKEKGHETHGGTISGDELLIAIVKKKGGGCCDERGFDGGGSYAVNGEHSCDRIPLAARSRAISSRATRKEDG